MAVKGIKQRYQEADYINVKTSDMESFLLI